MSKRALLFTILTLLVIGGLFSGLFAGSIQHALTLPMVQAMMDGANTSRSQATQRPTTTPAKMATPGGTTIQTQPMPTNVLAQDTFQRTNQTLWGTATDGRQWGADANASQAFSIQGAAGQIAHGQGILNAVLGPVSTNTDVIMSGMINAFGNSTNFGAVLRFNDANDCYKAFIDGTNLILIKRVKGQQTQLVSVPFQAQANITYKLHFRAIGAMLFASVWRGDATEPKQWMIITSDSSFTSGQDGVRVLVATNTVVTITSFVVTPAAMDATA